MDTIARKFVAEPHVRKLVASQAPAPTGQHFLVIKKNGDGRPCAFGKSSEFADALQVADDQWDAHGYVVDSTGRRSGCCYDGEVVGVYEIHLVSSKPLGEQL